jgi:L-alanine-DL-glutamate epimerase-like enolase superfamily enzyme
MKIADLRILRHERPNISPHAPGRYDLGQLSYGLAEPIAIDGEGYAIVPDRPGLGIDPDWDLLRSGTAEKLN